MTYAGGSRCHRHGAVRRTARHRPAGLPLRRIDQESDVSVLSVDYDVLVNCTYQSTAVNRARRTGSTSCTSPARWPATASTARTRCASAWAGGFRRRSCSAAASTNPIGGAAAARTDGAGVVDVYAPAGTAVASLCGPSRRPMSSCGTGAPRSAAADLDTGQAIDLPFRSSGGWPQQVVVQSDTYRQRRGPGWCGATAWPSKRSRSAAVTARRPRTDSARNCCRPTASATSTPTTPSPPTRASRRSGSSGCGSARARCCTRRCGWSTRRDGRRSR